MVAATYNSGSVLAANRGPGARKENRLPYISEQTIQEVLRSVDIYEVVSEYVPLRRSGANYKGVCPFHEEKSPSFMIHPERQIFKCFGCQKGGNVLGFVMGVEKVEFPDAVRLLADRAGITVRYEGGKPEGADRTDLHRVLEWAAKHYHALLKSNPAAEGARKYAAARGLTPETIDRWQIGFSLDSWDDLQVNARRNGFPERSLEAAGLAIPRESGGSYDRFRGRLMFPIRNPQGRVVGFGGRMLGEGEPKYLNSPETSLFSKSRLLFGLERGKEIAAQTKTLYIVEGYLDVILPAQHGVEGLVATLGTALTREHLGLLRRYAERIVLVFDSDEAGRRAAERGLDLLLEENLDLFVARVPGAKDPADLVVQEGPEALRRVLEKPVEIFEFLHECVNAKVGGETPAARARVIDEMTMKIARIPDAIKREVLVQQLATRSGVSETVIGDRVRSRVEPPAAAPSTGRQEPSGMTSEDQRGWELLALFVEDPEASRRIRSEVTPEGFPTEETRRVARRLYERYDVEGALRPGDLAAATTEESEMARAADVLSRKPASAETLTKRIELVLQDWKEREFRRTSEAVRAELKGIEGTPSDEVFERLKMRGARNSRGIPKSR